MGADGPEGASASQHSRKLVSFTLSGEKLYFILFCLFGLKPEQTCSYMSHLWQPMWDLHHTFIPIRVYLWKKPCKSHHLHWLSSSCCLPLSVWIPPALAGWKEQEFLHVVPSRAVPVLRALPRKIAIGCWLTSSEDSKCTDIRQPYEPCLFPILHSKSPWKILNSPRHSFVHINTNYMDNMCRVEKKQDNCLLLMSCLPHFSSCWMITIRI